MADRYDALLTIIEETVKELRELLPRKEAAFEKLTEAIEEATKNGEHDDE